MLLELAIKLNSGSYTPSFLFGTYKKIDAASLYSALEHGFFAFDMAAVYKTEDIVFDGIKKFLKDNPITDSRSKFYFCYKLDATLLLPEQVIEQVEVLLRKIKSVFSESPAYIDMLLIHVPNHNVPIELTWGTMQQLKLDKKVLEIGVSNFNIHHLKYMETMQLELPSVNQIEVNPFFIQPKLISYCDLHNITISSYRSTNIKANEKDLTALTEIASKLNLKPMQVINSWKYSKGFQIVAISKYPVHMEELKTAQHLTSGYMQQLDRMDKGEIGRTCAGTWSNFDFCGTEWLKKETCSITLT